MVIVRVNEEECSGCGICYNDECPEIFAEGDGGICMFLEVFQKGSRYVGEIPSEKKECAKRAAMACPNGAIVAE